jgi:predicted Ser/Thr protein kinase
MFFATQLLGKGSAAVVFKGEYEGNQVAIKIYRRSAKFSVKIAELDALKRIRNAGNCPYIVSVLGHASIPLVVEKGLVLGLFEGVTLKEAIQTGCLTTDRFNKIMEDTFLADIFLAKQGIIHADFHWENVLVNETETKMIDFGSALFDLPEIEYAFAVCYKVARIEGLAIYLSKRSQYPTPHVNIKSVWMEILSPRIQTKAALYEINQKFEQYVAKHCARPLFLFHPLSWVKSLASVLAELNQKIRIYLCCVVFNPSCQNRECTQLKTPDKKSLL